MKTFAFSALGTKWSIGVDEEIFSDESKKAILDRVALFESRFSRFRMDSEVNRFREAVAGTYEISEQFALLLTRADMLRQLTLGVYDPAVGGLLEHAGYDATYRLEADREVETFQLPRWSLEGHSLTLDGPAVFDFGGIGKGFCIDLVASILEQQSHRYYLVEGGGDMYGTTKRDGSPYRVALEWPGKPGMAFGIVTLSRQAVAVSDSFRRRWQQWHHIVDPHTKKPIEAIVGCAGLAPSAFGADSMTSALFLAPPEQHAVISEELDAQYVVFRSGGTVGVSPKWPGELF